MCGFYAATSHGVRVRKEDYISQIRHIVNTINLDDYPIVCLYCDGNLLTITLNRPEHGNGLNDAAIGQLAALLQGAATRARVVLLKGAGDDFCVGQFPLAIEDDIDFLDADILADFLDDGSDAMLERDGNAIFDFSQSDSQYFRLIVRHDDSGNNATLALLKSYCQTKNALK